MLRLVTVSENKAGTTVPTSVIMIQLFKIFETFYSLQLFERLVKPNMRLTSS